MEEDSDDGFGPYPDKIPGPSSVVLNNASSSYRVVVSSSQQAQTQTPELQQVVDPDVVDQYVAHVTERHRWESLPQQAWLTHSAERVFFSPYAAFDRAKRPRFVPVPFVPAAAPPRTNCS